MYKIKQWLFKKEFSMLESLTKSLKEKKEELEKRSNRLQEEKDLFEKEKQKEILRIISEYEDKYKLYFNEKKERIDDLLKYNLAPWNKVWVIRFDNQIEEIEINSISIKKDNIFIEHNYNFYWEYFLTEKEAIAEHNKRIEKLKK